MAADRSMRDYRLGAPHGPNSSGRRIAFADLDGMSYHEASAFDLPIAKRIRFVNKVNNAEAKKELKSIGRMMKADPLSPVGYYVRNMVIPGMGLLLEGYVLFSVGNVTPLLEAAFPQCWGEQTVCQPVWQQAMTYLEVVGIILGQIIVGILGDWLGRRWGLIQDALIMFIGLVMLTACWGITLNGWVICYALSLLFYGIGVGGEYPMTATSDMGNAVGFGKMSSREDRLHRGRRVTSAFLMQGWGQFLNQVILILLLLIFNSGSGDPPYDKVLAQCVFRVSFAIPAVGTLWLAYYRIYRMKSASTLLQAAKKKQSVTGYDIKSLGLTFTYFGPRLIATAFGWFANDVFFYGNKLFQSQFMAALNPDNKSVMTNWLWNLVNTGVALVGYYLASFCIDNKLYGRKWMQIIGFLGCFICFIIPAFNYSYYAEGPGIRSFQAMYFLSSFFGQFGPNAVTFLVAAEVFPTPVRASAHGFSAACGKLGALLAAVLFNYIDSRMRFLVVPWFGLLGGIVTYLFLPDTTGLDLKEQERRWTYIRAGREQEYHGIAIHSKHLSFWERIRGVSKHYNAEEDYKQRVEEMRADWESAMERRAAEGELAGDFGDKDDTWSPEVSKFFERTRDKTGGAAKGPYRNGAGASGESIDEVKEE
ncbi:hypothetical protein LTR37_010709 [Vermiconidia calcicola]|uniref:Uncharacterized protein n=1 Tax=Vermiconidia calcicola TaxID=1690605 RepID=A0ACC3N425_9PEZI|nr:hypothetical protein LTR37_010709 [Vermiconidia calcicola]